LAIATGQPRVFLWTPNGASICELSTNDPLGTQTNYIFVIKVKWNPKGNSLVLFDKTNAMIAFPGMDFMSSANSFDNILGMTNYGKM
jgi:hypothetical protein